MEAEKNAQGNQKHQEQDSAKPQKHNATPLKKSQLIIIGVIVLLLLGVVGFFAIQSFNTNNVAKNSKQQTVAKKVSDRLRARKATVDPAKNTIIQVYADNNMVIRLTIPQGALKTTSAITLTPYKDAKNNLAVQITPLKTSFSKPVTLTYDFERTSFKTDAPKTVSLTPRYTGKTQVLKTDDNASMQQLIARSTETNTALSARILSAGTYALVPTGDQITIARQTLKQKKASALSVLEAGSILVFTNQSLSNDEKERIKKTADKIATLPGASTYELFPALLLQKRLTTHAFHLVPQAYADLAAGFFEFRCKDKTLSVEEYVVAAQTAQALGHDDIGEKCLDAAKNRVAEEANKVLNQANPPVSEVIRMLGKVQMFGLADLDVALQEKLEKTIDKKIDDILKDPNATLTDVIKALQDAQISGTDGKYGDSLNQKIQDIANREIDQVLSDPHANMVDIAKAVQKAQALGIDGKADQGLERLKQMSNRSSEEILNNQNSSAKELQDALGQANLEGKDMDYRNKIRERIKEAQAKESEPEPSPTPPPGDNEENLEELPDAFTGLGLAMLQMMGLQSFDEGSIKDFVQQRTDMANEILDIAPEICDEARKNAELYTGMIAENCEYLEGGEARNELDEAHDKAFEMAEEVGTVQSDDYEAPDYEPHWEIEITPTPDPDENQIDEENNNTQDQLEDYGPQSSGTSNDSSESEVETNSGAEVEGAQTKNYVNILIDSVNKFLHPTQNK